MAGVGMEVLLVLVLLGFVFAPAGGRIVSKCELRDELTTAVAAQSQQLQQAGLTQDDFVAKIVCHAELESGFNSSSVKELLCPSASQHRRDQRSASYLGLLSVVGHDGSLSSVQSNMEEPKGQSSPPSPVRLKPDSGLRYDCEEGDESWTLYGLFQLLDRLTCSDGVTPSPNICQMDCINLMDDDILDDVHCLLLVFRNLVENGFSATHWRQLRGAIRLILQEECRDKLASEYFAECS